LLIEDWTQHILSSATIVFFDSNEQQFFTVDDIYISRQHAHGHPLISPADYDKGDLTFGALEHFTTSLPSKVAIALCRRITGQIDAREVYIFP
jgi:hypothetical protein